RPRGFLDVAVASESRHALRVEGDHVGELPDPIRPWSSSANASTRIVLCRATTRSAQCRRPGRDASSRAALTATGARDAIAPLPAAPYAHNTWSPARTRRPYAYGPDRSMRCVPS